MNFKKPALNYTGQGLTEFPKEIFTTPRVYKLNLSHNNIKEIPQEISQLKYLETLDLSGNQVRHVKAKLCDLPNLKILILKDNQIISLPKQMVILKLLKILSLSNNNLSQLPPELAELPNLEELNVAGNYLNTLPLDGDKPFPKLKSLWIGQNPLKKLNTDTIVNKLPNLKSFYCYSPKMDKPVLSDDPAIEVAARKRGNSMLTLSGYVQHPDETIFYHNMTEPTAPSKNGKIFISYSHQDKEYLNRLQVHLKVLGRGVPIDPWADTRIRSSDRWKDEIENALSEASTAILLVSTDFLASDFIQDEELPKLLKAAENKGTRIHPVIIHPCQFLKTKSLSQFEAANSPSEALSELSFPMQEKVWMKLCDDIQFYLER